MAKKEKIVNNINYNTLHWWIRRNYGSANVCQNPTCKCESFVFEWSLLKGKEYEKKIENYWQLCRKCHFEYDGRDYQKKKFNEGRIKANKSWKGSRHTDISKNKMSLALKGRKAWNKGKKWSDEAKLKMSLSHKGKIPWNKGLKLV